MKTIMLFAGGPPKDGEESSSQRERCFFNKVQKFLSSEVIILFAKEAISFSPPCLYSTRITSALLKMGLPSENIVVLPALSDATVKEVDAAEIYLREHQVKKVYAASSWYHLPRIWLMWLFRHKRFVRFFPIWVTEKEAVFVEIPKYPLLFTPPSWQEKLGKLWIKIFH